MEQALLFLPLAWLSFHVLSTTGRSTADIAPTAWFYVV
jgi:hypothetical protein